MTCIKKSVFTKHSVLSSIIIFLCSLCMHRHRTLLYSISYSFGNHFFFFLCGRFYWEWLPAFSGVPGRINELGGGDGAFADSVFIGGEFTPPVLVWRNDPHIGPSTTGEEISRNFIVGLCSGRAVPPR